MLPVLTSMSVYAHETTIPLWFTIGFLMRVVTVLNSSNVWFLMRVFLLFM